MPAARQTGKHGASEVTCAMCRAELPVSLMVPDGGNACDDVRWYCRDTVACTQRWTAAQARQAAADEEAGRGTPDDPPAEHDAPDGEQNGYRVTDEPDGEQKGNPVTDEPDGEHNGHPVTHTPDGEQSGNPVTGMPDGEQSGNPVTEAPGGG